MLKWMIVDKVVPRNVTATSGFNGNFWKRLEMTQLGQRRPVVQYEKCFRHLLLTARTMLGLDTEMDDCR
jgi:hypothetical protein